MVDYIVVFADIINGFNSPHTSYFILPPGFGLTRGNGGFYRDAGRTSAGESQ